MANDPSKTIGLAKLSSNFTGLAVSIFLAAMCVVSQSQFFSQCCLQVSTFYKAKKVSKYQLIWCWFLYKWHLNVLEPEHLKLSLKSRPRNLRSQNVKCLGKKNASLSQILAFSIHHPFNRAGIYEKTRDVIQLAWRFIPAVMYLDLGNGK